MRNEDDRRLVRRCLQEDSSAFETLLQRYERAIFNASYRLVGHYEDARDITQTVFLKAYQSLASYDPAYKFHSWLYRIAINESINFRNRRKPSEPLDTSAATHPAAGPDPETACSNSEISGHIQEALMAMKPEHRIVIVLKHFQGFSYQDIGQVIKKPEKTVKSRLFTARQILKELLEQRGVL